MPNLIDYRIACHIDTGLSQDLACLCVPYQRNLVICGEVIL